MIPRRKLRIRLFPCSITIAAKLARQAHRHGWYGRGIRASARRSYQRPWKAFWHGCVLCEAHFGSSAETAFRNVMLGHGLCTISLGRTHAFRVSILACEERDLHMCGNIYKQAKIDLRHLDTTNFILGYLLTSVQYCVRSYSQSRQCVKKRWPSHQQFSESLRIRGKWLSVIYSVRLSHG